MWVIKRKDGSFYSISGFSVYPYVYRYEDCVKIDLDNLIKQGNDVELFELTPVKQEEKKIYFRDVKVGQKFEYKRYPKYSYVKTDNNQKFCIKFPLEEYLFCLEDFDEVMTNVEVKIIP